MRLSPNLALEVAEHAEVQQGLGGPGVAASQAVVHQDHIGVGVARPGQREPRLLAAREVDPSLANLGPVAVPVCVRRR